jgi:hypothetical protein
MFSGHCDAAVYVDMRIQGYHKHDNYGGKFPYSVHCWCFLLDSAFMHASSIDIQLVSRPTHTFIATIHWLLCVYQKSSDGGAESWQ